MKPYPSVEGRLCPILRVAMPRKVCQRHYRALLLPSPDPRLDACDPRWTTQRAMGSAALLTRYLRDAYAVEIVDYH